MGFLRKVYSVLIDLTETLVIAGAVFVVIYAFLFRPFQVNGQSMFPNYHHGEYILTNLISLRFGSLQRGDVIVFQAPRDQEKDFIKRVIGLPGENVSLRKGSVYINGEKLNESGYLTDSVKTYGGAFTPDEKTIKIPEKEFFVLGDNRNFSSDSREWGLVSQSKIIGKSFFVYWPVTRMRLVERGKYK